MEEKIQEVPLYETSSGEQNNTKYQDKAPSKTFETSSQLYSSQSQSLWPRPAKKKNQKKEFFVPEETWTHGLCCLADCTSKTVSSRTEMLQLQSSDLGRK